MGTRTNDKFVCYDLSECCHWTHDAGTHRGSVSTLFTARTSCSNAVDKSAFSITSSNRCPYKKSIRSLLWSISWNSSSCNQREKFFGKACMQVFFYAIDKSCIVRHETVSQAGPSSGKYWNDRQQMRVLAGRITIMQWQWREKDFCQIFKDMCIRNDTFKHCHLHMDVLTVLMPHRLTPSTLQHT